MVVIGHPSPEVRIGRTPQTNQFPDGHVLHAGLLRQYHTDETAQLTVAVVTQFTLADKDTTTKLGLKGRERAQ